MRSKLIASDGNIIDTMFIDQRFIIFVTTSFHVFNLIENDLKISNVQTQTRW